MFIGIPRGAYYYEYCGFLKRLFEGGGVEIVEGIYNEEEILKKGVSVCVDEACLPVKLFAGQVASLIDSCDMIFIPRIEKDFSGRWSCPKLIGLPELLVQVTDKDKLLITEPIDFSNKKIAKSTLWKACKRIGMNRVTFGKKFDEAYRFQKDVALGKRSMHVEADWEFTPEVGEDEIMLPNLGKVLLIGHSYNVFDKFSNGHVMEKLDELGLKSVTEGDVPQNCRETEMRKLELMKIPFWSTLVNTVGTVLYIKDQVEGIVYVSSFSCGQDPFIIELIKKHAGDLPVMVLKLDEHKGTAGLDTRLEAFADLLERRRAS